jgi:hypothetical protein
VISLRILFSHRKKLIERLNNMPGMLTRIKVIYPVWLAIKWLVIVTIVSRSGGCGGNHGGAMQKPSLSDGWITNTGPFDIAMTSTDCAVFVKPDTLVRTT